MFVCEKDADKFFTFSNSHHPNIKFTFKKEKDTKIAFLDIWINKPSHSFYTSVFWECTLIGLYTNFSSFTSFSYKTGLIKTLIHRSYAISSSRNLFHDEIRNTKYLLEKNMYPPFSIDKQTKLFLNNKLSKNDTPKENSNKENTTYHKLPYNGDISVRTKKKIGELCKRFYKNIDIITVLTPFKIGSLFSSKDRLPSALRPFVVYKFTCAGCQFCYIVETRRHLTTRIKEHLVTDKKSHIMKHLFGE